MSLNKVTVASGSDIADLFTKHFLSVYTVKSMTSVNMDTVINNVITNINYSLNEVLKTIKELNLRKGPGPDNIPPLFVKKCGSILALPLLCLIFNRSFKDGLFP